MEPKKIASLALGVVAALGVLAAVVWSNAGLKGSSSAASSASSASSAPGAAATLTRVSVLTGSEKLPFLTDPRLQVLLAKQGLAVEPRKAGSREIATRTDLASFDVAFPAGQPAATKIRSVTKARATETVFVTPLAIATWQPVADLLKANDIVKEDAGALWVVDMDKLLGLMKAGTRWRDLPHNKSFPVGRSVLISTTDVRTSNSAAQFLALTSYLLNGRDVVTDAATASRIADQVLPFFAKQGQQEASSSGPFDDYLTIGQGKVPMVWIYESQYFEQSLRGALKPAMVLVYPQPTIFSKHTAVALSDAGVRFIEAMKDPQVRAIAAEYGFRAEGAEADLKKKLQAKGLPLPTLVDVADAPAHDVLEKMISQIEAKLAL